jgi:hypothetical protein
MTEDNLYTLPLDEEESFEEEGLEEEEKWPEEGEEEEEELE